MYANTHNGRVRTEDSVRRRPSSGGNVQPRGPDCMLYRVAPDEERALRSHLAGAVGPAVGRVEMHALWHC